MVKYLTIGKKEYPVRVSYYVLKRVQEELKKDGKNQGLSNLDIASLDFTTLELMLFYGLKKGAQMDDIPFTFTMEQMEDVMDEVFFTFTAMIPEFFPKNEGKKGTEEKKQKGEPTKKPLKN